MKKIQTLRDPDHFWNKFGSVKGNNNFSSVLLMVQVFRGSDHSWDNFRPSFVKFQAL